MTTRLLPKRRTSARKEAEEGQQKQDGEEEEKEEREGEEKITAGVESQEAKIPYTVS